MKGNFDRIINDPKPVIIDFHALWCGPCKVQSPVLEEIAGELHDKIRVIKIDVDKNESIADRYNIRSVPTIMIFKSGNVLYKRAGLHQKDELIHLITKNI
jgi:thioredoxin 1